MKITKKGLQMKIIPLPVTVNRKIKKKAACHAQCTKGGER